MDSVQFGKPYLLISVGSSGVLVKLPTSGVTHTLSCLPDVCTLRWLVLSQLGKTCWFSQRLAAK